MQDAAPRVVTALVVDVDHSVQLVSGTERSCQAAGEAVAGPRSALQTSGEPVLTVRRHPACTALVVSWRSEVGYAP